MKLAMHQIRPGDAALILRKWVIVHDTKNEIGPEGRTTRLRGHCIRQGRAEAVELTVPMDWSVAVHREPSAGAASPR